MTAPEISSDALTRELERIMLAALTGALSENQGGDNGLLVRQFPTESHLEACVTAVKTLLSEVPDEGLVVIIGSDSRPAEPTGDAILVLPPHEAAAAATHARNARRRVVFICEADSPGASGINADVLRPLAGERLAYWYAKARGHALLELASQSAVAGVRLRFAGRSVEDLARYGLAVEGAEPAVDSRSETSSGRFGETVALPLLDLLPDRLSGDPRLRPTASWAQSFASLDGAKLVKKLREAAAALKQLKEKGAPEAAEAKEALRQRALPHEFQGQRDALTIAIELAEAAARFAAGDVEAQTGLRGLSGALLRLLRKGDAIRGALTANEDGGDDEPGTDVGELSDRPLREREALDLLHRPAIAREEDWRRLQLGPGEEDEHPQALIPSRRPTFAASLIAAAPPALWRSGGYVLIEEETPFTADAPLAREWPTDYHVFHGQLLDGLPSALTEAVSEFRAARGALLDRVADLAPAVDGEGAEGEEPEPAGDAEAVLLIDAFPLLVTTQAREEVLEYTARYAALLRAVAESEEAPANGSFITWLVNLDVAVHAPARLSRARLLPLHPLRLERARLELELGIAPPDLPASLTLYTSGQLEHLHPEAGDRYAKTHFIRPTAEGVASCAKMGLEATWLLLEKLDLGRAIRVELKGLADPTAAASALGARFLELAGQAAAGDGAAHLEVIVTEGGALDEGRLSLEGLSDEVSALLKAPRGQGLSVAMNPTPQRTGAQPVHLIIEEATCHVFAPPALTAAPAGAGAWVQYEPGHKGNIQRVSARGSAVEEARRRLDDVVAGSASRYAMAPPGGDQSTRGAIVRAVASRNGWPIDPTAPTGVLAYDVDREENYVAVVVSPEVLEPALRSAYSSAMPGLLNDDGGVSQEDLTRGTIRLHGLRRAQLGALRGDEDTKKKLRGDLGELKAFCAVDREAPESLPIDLNSPTAHEWAAFHSRAYGSRSRPDLLLLEPDPDSGRLRRMRLIELKARGAAPTSAEARAKLARQAVLGKARVRAAFSGDAEDPAHNENVQGLRRVCWLEAGRQRRAKALQPLLEDLDRRLVERDPPELTAECWVVPDAPWHRDPKFDEEVKSLDVRGEVTGDLEVVNFRVLGPLSARGALTHDAPEEQSAASPPRSEGAGARVEQAPARAAEEAPPTSAGPSSAATEAPQPRRRSGALSLLLGATDDGEALRFSPDEMENRNMMITGSPGTGKTQLLKALVLQLRSQGAPTIILDFKNDYASDVAFCEAADLERVFVRFDGLPYNPLIPPRELHPGTGEAFLSVISQVQGLSATLKATYGLGVQQEGRLKDAMRSAYESKRIEVRGSQKASEVQEYPDFAQVGETLRGADERAYARLDPLFDLDLFKPKYCDTPFEDLLGRAVVLDFSQLPSDEIKAALARIFLISAHGYYNSLEHSAAARQFFVFDEAHRMKDEPRLETFVRECRAYGVGVIISSQYPTDFTPSVSAALATKLAHGNGKDVDRVKAIVRLLGLAGRERLVEGLQMFEIMAQSSRFGPEFARTLNYPALATLRFLCRHPEGSTEEEAATAPGLDPAKTRAASVLRQLEVMRFAQKGPDDLWRPAREICASLEP